MSYITKVIGDESGIQYQGVNDKTGSLGDMPINNMIIGSFRRGRTDRPMIITSDNIRSKLGYDPTNPDYVAVQDALATKTPSVTVLRVVVSDEVVIVPDERAFEYFPSNKNEFDRVLAAATFNQKDQVINFYDLNYPLSITGYNTETVLFNWNDVDLNVIGKEGYLFTGTRIKESWLDNLLVATAQLDEGTVVGTLVITTPSTSNFIQNLTLSFFRNLKQQGTSVVLDGYVYTWNVWPVAEDIVKIYSWNIDYSIGDRTFSQKLTTDERVYTVFEDDQVGEGSNSAVFNVSKDVNYQVFIDGEQLANSVTGGNTFSDLWLYSETNALIQSLIAQSYPLVGFGLQTPDGTAVLPLTLENPTHLFRNTNTVEKDYKVKFVGTGLSKSNVDEGLQQFGFEKNYSYVYKPESVEFIIKAPDFLTFKLDNSNKVTVSNSSFEYAVNRPQFQMSGSGKPNKSYNLIFSTDDGYTKTFKVQTISDGTFVAVFDIQEFYAQALNNNQTMFSIRCPNNVNGGTQSLLVMIPVRNTAIDYNIWANTETASSNMRDLVIYAYDSDIGTDIQLKITDSLGNTATANAKSTDKSSEYLGSGISFRPRTLAEVSIDCGSLTTNELQIETVYTSSSGELCKTSGTFSSYSPDMIIDVDTTSSADNVIVNFAVESLTTQAVVTVLTPNAQFQRDVAGNTTGTNQAGQLYHARTESLNMYFVPNQGIVRVRFNMNDNVPINNAEIWSNTAKIAVVKYGLRTKKYTITDITGTKTEAGKFV